MKKKESFAKKHSKKYLSKQEIQGEEDNKFEDGEEVELLEPDRGKVRKDGKVGKDEKIVTTNTKQIDVKKQTNIQKIHSNTINQTPILTSTNNNHPSNYSSGSSG